MERSEGNINSLERWRVRILLKINGLRNSAKKRNKALSLLKGMDINR